MVRRCAVGRDKATHQGHVAYDDGRMNALGVFSAREAERVHGGKNQRRWGSGNEFKCLFFFSCASPAAVAGLSRHGRRRGDSADLEEQATGSLGCVREPRVPLRPDCLGVALFRSLPLSKVGPLQSWRERHHVVLPYQDAPPATQQPGYTTARFLTRALS